jgi:hypothetical protein
LPPQSVHGGLPPMVEPFHQFTLPPGRRPPREVAPGTRASQATGRLDTAVPMTTAWDPVARVRHEAPRFIAEDGAAAQGRGEHPIGLLPPDA